VGNMRNNKKTKLSDSHKNLLKEENPSLIEIIAKLG
jgi:hypothetical protein